MDIHCYCGCGEVVPPPSRATMWRLKTGRIPGVYLPGHAHRGENNPRWNGGRSDFRGYVLVQCPDHPSARKNGYILEHRLVMSEHLGRPLGDDELVHHKNGDKSDNRLANLEVMDRPTHTAVHSTGEENGRWVDMPPKTCAKCGTSFMPAHRCNYKRARFCSRACCNAPGSLAPARKLTLEDEVEISKARGMTLAALAEQYGVSLTTIKRARRKHRS